VLQCGQPNEETPTTLLWFDRALRKRTQLTNHQGVHTFPTPRADLLTQHIDNEAPPDKFEELVGASGRCWLRA